MLIRGSYWIRVSVLLNIMGLMPGCAHVDSTSSGRSEPVKEVAAVSIPSTPLALNEFMAHVMQYRDRKSVV